MSILLRVEEIRAVEHRKLRRALARAWSELKRLEEQRLKAARAAPETNLFGEPVATDEVRVPASQVNLRPLFDAWAPFEDAVLARLDRWEQDLWPQVRDWDQGRPVGPAVQSIAQQLGRDRAVVEGHLRKVRRAAQRVGELRAPMLSLYSAIELCDRAEQQTLPALESGDRVLADHTERGRTPADVVRALRQKITSQDSEPDTDPEPVEPSALGRFMGWFGQGR